MIVYRLENELKPALHSATEVKIATAKLTKHGLDMLLEKIQDDCKLELLVGIDMLTPVPVLVQLMNINKSNWDVKIYTKPKSFFHPKVYFLRGRTNVMYIGSGNYTKGGMLDNVELFYKADHTEAPAFEKWFNTYFKLGTKITQPFLDEYDKYSKKAEEAESTSRNSLRDIKKKFDGGQAKKVDLNSIDFTDQYFKYKHFNAFAGTKPTDESEVVNKERAEVWDKLFELHEILYPVIKSKGWDIHPHHIEEYIVSSFKHGEYTNESLGALWLHYGRSEADIEKFKRDYGDRQTSMYQMRLQILVHAYDVSIWLRVGKNSGSIVDRTNFKDKMRSPSYRDRFYKLLQALPQDYFISINDVSRPVHSFQDAATLHAFVKEDNIAQEYFIIGREYTPDDKRLSDQTIVSTVIDDFALLYPIYLHIRTVI